MDREFYSIRSRLRVMAHMLRLENTTSRATAIGATTLLLLASAGTPLIAWSQRWIVDSATGGSTAGVVGAVALGVVAHMVGVMVWRVHLIMRHSTGERVNVALSQELLTLTASIPTIEHLERAEYLDRLTTLFGGIDLLVTAYWSVVKTTAVAAGLIASVMLLASVNPALMALTLLAIPPFFFNGRGQRAVARARQAAAEPKRHEQHLHDLCTQSATLKEVMIAGSGAELDARAARRWEQSSRLEHRARLTSVLWRSVGWAWFSAGFIGALTYVAWLVLHHQASVGDIVLVLTVAGSLQSQLSMTVVTASDVADAGDISANYLWLRRYSDNQHRGPRSAPESLRDGIDLRGIRFAYPGASRDVLVGLDAHLPAGATIGLVGVNGAGKTTLVKLLTGLCRPTSGRIEVDGVDLADIDPHGWSAALTGAFQDYSRFQFRARESIGAGSIDRVDDTAAVSGAVSAAGADTVIDALRDGLETQLGAVFEGVDLSHGQWQKLAIARSYMRSSPKLLVLDEPTAALDPHAEQELFERFTAHARALGQTHGSIALMVSHRFSTIHMADLILVLADGAIVEQGTHQQLMAAGGSYAELYRKQAAAYADEKNRSGR